MTRGKKLFDGLGQQLEPGEAIKHVIDGAYEVNGSGNVRHGLVVATDRRVLCFSLTPYGGHDLESFGYPTITGFEQTRGLMGGSVSFTTADAEATVKLIPPGSAFTRFCRWMQSQVAEPVQAST